MSHKPISLAQLSLPSLPIIAKSFSIPAWLRMRHSSDCSVSIVLLLFTESRLYSTECQMVILPESRTLLCPIGFTISKKKIVGHIFFSTFHFNYFSVHILLISYNLELVYCCISFTHNLTTIDYGSRHSSFSRVLCQIKIVSRILFREYTEILLLFIKMIMIFFFYSML